MALWKADKNCVFSSFFCNFNNITVRKKKKFGVSSTGQIQVIVFNIDLITKNIENKKPSEKIFPKVRFSLPKTNTEQLLF